MQRILKELTCEIFSTQLLTRRNQLIIYRITTTASHMTKIVPTILVCSFLNVIETEFSHFASF